MERVPVKRILQLLAERYPKPRPALNYNSPFELLIATILSAQSTDRQVNIITEKLFKKYKSPEDYSRLSVEILEKDIRGCGLYRNKAKNIIQACRILVEKFNSQVPANRKDLMLLPGVGRKTANVVLSNAFGVPAIAVDTHVFRVANRLGLAGRNNVLGTEQDLMKRIPRQMWSDAHHWLIFLGRDICRARKPNCISCPLGLVCRYGRENQPED